MSAASIGPYLIIEKVGESHKSVVYRCRGRGADETVIVKLLKKAAPTPADVARIRLESALVERLDFDGIVRGRGIIEHEGAIALVLEDPHGISLKDFISRTRPTLRQFLDIAVRLARILGLIHRANIIHKDIKPHNIIIRTARGRVRDVHITDFGISVLLDDGLRELYHPDVLQGTLPYISPEQTGRMNRPVDYRTDLYSLGVTFYELLTGDVPFHADDPLELIHAHMARAPEPPAAVNPALAGPVSDIVMKLLAKSPDERYQNALGLAYDLQECHARLVRDGRIAPFELSTRDIAERLTVPQVLFGRERERDQLFAAFERVVGGTAEMVLISGAPGIGKTSLAMELHKPVTARSGFFVAGKYDALRRDVPYTAIIQAFQGLIRQILTEGEERIDLWRIRLETALGLHAKIIGDQIPELRLIIGEQPEVAQLDLEEAHNRFTLVFRNFMSVFAKPEHPLVVFLDDLQWADSASLTLLTTVLADRNMRSLLLLGAIREGPTVDSLLDQAVSTLQTAGVAVSTLSLGPLEPDAVGEYLANFLRVRNRRQQTFAEIVYEKTLGNPFFINQFIGMLYDDGLIRFDPESGWNWSLAKLRALEVSDNVVELMAKKIGTLPPRTQEALQIASVIGNRFSLETVSIVNGTSVEQSLEDLTAAAREGLIFFSAQEGRYRFFHDRIHEAAYSLIADDDTIMLHYRIGHLAIAESNTRDALMEKIFYIANHLNIARSLFESDGERFTLARMNLYAGMKAKNAAAFESARGYFTQGTDVLPDSAFAEEYQLSFDLYLNRGECEYIAGRFDEATTIFAIILTFARCALDRARIYNMLIILCTNGGEYREAVQFARDAMMMFGVDCSRENIRAAVSAEFAKVMEHMERLSLDEIAALPEMRDPELLARMEIMTNCAAATFYVDLDFNGFLPLHLFNCSIEHGNSPYAAFGYSMFSVVHFVRGNFARAFAFGELALSLNRRYDNIATRSKVPVIVGVYTVHWSRHVREGIALLEEGYRARHQTGDLIYTGFFAVHLALMRAQAGDELGPLLQDVERYLELTRQIRFDNAGLAIATIRQKILSLMGRTRDRAGMDSDGFSEQEHVARLRASEMTFALHSHLVHAASLRYLFGDIRRAFELSTEALRYSRYSTGLLHQAEENFFRSLIVAELVGAGMADIDVFSAELEENQRRLKLWAESGPGNFLHKYLLVEAERAILADDPWTAMARFDEAIESALENGYVQHAALACERAGRFYRSRGRRRIARQYLIDADRLYGRWGAAAKRAHLAEAYPGLLDRTPDEPSAGAPGDTDTGSDTISRDLDLSTIIKATHAVAREIDLGAILAALITIAIENAGAQSGYLLLENERDGRLYIEASGAVGERPDVLQSILAASCDQLSAAVVNYVHKTRENIVLDNALEQGMFTEDGCIARKRSRSLLCVPIMHKNRAIGVLYLENALVDGAFTPARVELLTILSSQAAISIENARLLATRESQARLAREMEIAARIQTILLPVAPRIDGFEITGYMRPAEKVGGDYYDVINTPSRDWVIIGDVSGHGVSAGLVMMMVQTAIHFALSRRPGIRPVDLLTHINRGISENIHRISAEKYMTIVLLAHLGDGRFELAGLHPDILVYRARTGAVERVRLHGNWIGIPERVYPKNWKSRNQTLALHTGDVMLLYTDGITESRSADEDMLDQAGLERILQKAGGGSTNAIRDAILERLAEYTSTDDITMLILKRT
ncbi:MAG TPA: AAA family ATPase [Spirochaetota bacterium]|nr:AAA family ATPase [Spirochaetota bacterium]HNT11509.1 AAA family ATPase [Spirochaetota bacterium]